MPEYPEQGKGRVLIFARTPEIGAVKTRLQPRLGELGCYQLHESLVAQAIETAVQSGVAPVEVWHTGNPDHSFWQEKKKKYAIRLREQQGADLGARMLDAVARHLRPGLTPEIDSVDWVIVMGSDCPEIDRGYLEEASSALASGNEIVLGPAQDGGYVLIGLRKAYDFLFENIPWGTESVLAETLAAAKENNRAVYPLRTLRDLDVAADLSYYQSKLPWTNSISTQEFISKT